MNNNRICTNNDNQKNIKAEMTYMVKDKIRHQTIMAADMDPKKTKKIGRSVKKTVQVRNGRCENDLTIDKAAFELVNCPTSLSTEEFYKIQEGNEEFKNKYYKELEKMVKAKLGCDKVIFWNCQVRNEKKRYVTGNPHLDLIFDQTVGKDTMNQLEKENDTTKYKRAVYVNFWRNISDQPIKQNHLAMVGERSLVKPDDFMENDYIFSQGFNGIESGTAGALSSTHADHHKWYYFPEMVKDEGILFKNYDTDFTQTSRNCFHSAVFDKSAPEDAPTRQSIEVRMYCYFKEAKVDTLSTTTKESTVCMTRKEREQTITNSLSTSTMVKSVLGRFSPMSVVVGSIALACLKM